jgi:hypothetical protein
VRPDVGFEPPEHVLRGRDARLPGAPPARTERPVALVRPPGARAAKPAGRALARGGGALPVRRAAGYPVAVAPGSPPRHVHRPARYAARSPAPERRRRAQRHRQRRDRDAPE